jgi:mycoredoxin
MIEQGKFVEYEVHGNGHFYGRIFDDFIGKYAIIEVTLGGKKAYEKRFPNMFTVYLDPDPSYTEQERAKAIFRRGGLSKEEAKRRAKKAAQGVARSKKIDFDLRVTMMKGKYTEGARKILAEIPSTNPQEKLDVGITQEEQEESDRLIALDKERIAAEEAEEAAEAAEAAEANKLREERFVQTTLPIEEPEEDEEWDAEEAYRELHDDSPWANPTKKKCPLPPKKGIIVYGASWCGPCRMTKKYLDEQGKKYKYVDIEEVKDYFKTIGPLTNNYKYIPVIFIDGKFLEGGYTALIARKNPHHCPIEVEARRAASDPSFIHHEWYIEHHLDYVMAIAKAIVHSDEPEDQQLIHDMVWMHDYPKMLGDKDNFELVREFVSKHRSERYTDRLMNQLRWMEEIKSPDWSGRTTTIAAVMSTADALAHYHGPFFQIFHDENPDTPIAELKKKNKAKLKKDKLKLRAGPKRKALDSIKFKYRGRKVRIVGNEHIAELIARKNPKVIVKKDKYRSRFVDEDGNDVTSIPVSSVELKEGVGSAKFGKSLTKKEAHRDRSGEWLRVSVSAYKGKQPIFEVAPIKFFDFGEGPNLTFFRTTGRKYFKNLKVEGPVYPTILSQIEEEPHAVLIVQGRLKVKIGDKWVNSDNMFYAKPEIRDDITDWVGESKGRRFEVFEEGEIVSVDTITRQFTYRPYKGGMMAEFHHYNRTKRETTQIYNVHMSDEGDHYWLHEIQVAEAARRKGTMLRAIQHTVFNMPEFLPDYPDKKPIRTLARAVEGIPQEKLVEALLNSGFEVLEQDVDGGVLMEFKWYEETKENPAYPVKWQQNPYILLIEPWTETEVMIDEDLARLMQVMWGQGIMTTNSDQPGEQRWTINGKEFRKPKDGQISIKNQESLDKILAKLPEIEQIFTPTIVSQANDGYAVRIQHTRAYYDSLAANNIVFSHITDRPKQPRMEELWEAKYHMRFSKDGLNRLHEAFGIPPLYTFQNPPPRSKPFPWNKNRVRRSIFKTMKRAQATLVSWNKGNAIGSPAVFALRSMGKIPRASGKYELR